MLIAGLYSPFPYYFISSVELPHIATKILFSFYISYFCIWILISTGALWRTKQRYPIQNIWWACKRSHLVSGSWISKSYKDRNEDVIIEGVGRLSVDWCKRIKKGNLYTGFYHFWSLSLVSCTWPQPSLCPSSYPPYPIRIGLLCRVFQACFPFLQKNTKEGSF